MFVCAGNGEEFGFAQSIGVGLIQSAINLTKLCQKGGVDFLAFVGSAGSYDLNLPFLGLYIGTESTQIESSLIAGASYSPLSLREKSLDVSHETIQSIKALGLSSAVVNSSNYITTDLAMSQRMRQRGILLENMEFFSVLSVARTFQIPAIGVFCVSNHCNANAHQDFLQNRVDVMAKLSELYAML